MEVSSDRNMAKMCIAWCIIHPMRTNIELDDTLVSEAKELSGMTTKKAVVNEALRFYVEIKGRKRLSDLRGKLEFAPGYDHKRLRQGSEEGEH